MTPEKAAVQIVRGVYGSDATRAPLGLANAIADALREAMANAAREADVGPCPRCGGSNHWRSTSGYTRCDDCGTDESRPPM